MSVEDDARQKELKAYKKLPEEWRENQLAAKTPELYKAIIKSSMNIVQLSIAKELDQDLKALKEQVKTANAVYSEGTKASNLQIKFLVDILRGRGEDVPDAEDFVKKAATGEPIVE